MRIKSLSATYLHFTISITCIACKLFQQLILQALIIASGFTLKREREINWVLSLSYLS